MAHHPVPPAPTWTVISNGGPYPLAQQDANNWCWAAVLGAVDGFYAGHAAASQCAIASTVLHAACCPPVSGGPHDVDQALDVGLIAVNHYAGTIAGRAAEAIVSGEISANRPVGARIAYSATRGHAIALIGFAWTSSNLLVEIGDPDPAYSRTTHRGLYGSTPPLHLSGTWSNAYLTK
ncbi:MAG TPA: papain-like cysteine protease family protein [Aliidongia sp.]|nr:papain-like cysteine protease family protein [Aliidongia sp.]